MSVRRDGRRAAPTLNDLPAELRDQVTSHLDLPNLASLAQTSRGMRQLAQPLVNARRPPGGPAVAAQLDELKPIIKMLIDHDGQDTLVTPGTIPGTSYRISKRLFDRSKTRGWVERPPSATGRPPLVVYNVIAQVEAEGQVIFIVMSLTLRDHTRKRMVDIAVELFKNGFLGTVLLGTFRGEFNARTGGVLTYTRSNLHVNELARRIARYVRPRLDGYRVAKRVAPRRG